ncbi:MAG: SNF2-related protein [Kofleriaceae bacterium]
MKKQAFNTGEPHQAAVATWARKRIVDRGGAFFNDGTGHDTPAQIGCLFADGVGLGKTWEALATIALLLAKGDLRKRRRRSRNHRRKDVNLRRRRAHVLVLVPPGLVAKWSHELRNPDGFQRCLARWAWKRSRAFVADTLDPNHCFEIRRRRDLADLPRGKRKRGKYVLPAGTYVCNWNVFLGPGGRGLDRVSKLRSQPWDVVVVDEAHHRAARRALDLLRDADHRLLLTATPFQLDMTELHGLTKHLVEGKAAAHKVLKRGAVRDYARLADQTFEDENVDPPTKLQRRDAERVLGQLVACSQVGRQQRRYFAINLDGKAEAVPPPTDLGKQNGIAAVFDHAIDPAGSFDEWYLRQRLSLAKREAGDTSRHVAVELRKALSIGKGAPSRPKLDALRAWARVQFREDLEESLARGVPHKLLVFSHLKADVIQPIQQALEQELRAAHRELAQTPPWKAARAKAASALDAVLEAIDPYIRARKRAGGKIARQLAAFRRAVEGSVFFDLLGKRAFATRVTKELLDLVGAEEQAARKGTNDDDDEIDDDAWYAHQIRTKQRAAMAVLGAIARAPLSATFTGDDTRYERDAIAEAFTTALAPWILVATNVGSEGIDLHRYSRHLVHFDLEWNPARLEQREGRIDRLGRELKEPARIYYLLVKDTYDERMFHQLIARQRWHGILLGRRALQLDRDDAETTARWISQRDADRLSLNLDPRTSGRR